METLKQPLDNSAALSSSPAFGTPLHPVPPSQAQRPPPPAFKPSISTILAILLPPPTLRPLAFRTFTKKHNLTLNSSALQALATFIGRHCGTGWREEGTGERVLEEVAKLWKAEGGAVIVEDGAKLNAILRTLEGSMSGGRVGPVKRNGSDLSRQSSFAFGNDSAVDLSHDQNGLHRPSLGDTRTDSFGMSKLQVEEFTDKDEKEDTSMDPRAWLEVISAFDQPRLSYDMEKKHFIPLTSKPSMFPSPSHKTALFRERYNIIHQRLLRNEAFQTPSFSMAQAKANGALANQQFYKLTPIANLLGRGGTSHLLLGQLVIAPTGTLALNDPSGSTSLSLEHATPLQGEDSAYFCPGMIVLVDGVYEEDWAGAGSSGLGSTGGVGGTIGGRFIGFSIGGPPVEKRDLSLGISLNSSNVGGGFGWTDFLGLGSERAIGTRMRKLEQRLLSPSHSSMEEGSQRRKMIILSEVTLDSPTTLSALRKVLSLYSSDKDAVPMTFLLIGNFTTYASMAGTSTDSIAYKEAFNSLAAILSDFPSLLRTSTWVFVPGDNDPWASAFSAGASTLVPREGVPEVFTSRVQRAFAAAGGEGEAVWTSNPARLSFFGPAHEVCVFRDGVEGRFRRSAVRVGKAAKGPQQERQQQRHEEIAGGGDEDIVMSGAIPTTEAEDNESQVDASVEEAMTLDSLSPPNSATETYATAQAKKLILSLLPQSTLSPFPLSLRPTHWDHTTSALSLYPLPHTLVLADPDAEPFALTFEGCHVINPGRLVGREGEGGKRKRGYLGDESYKSGPQASLREVRDGQAYDGQFGRGCFGVRLENTVYNENDDYGSDLDAFVWPNYREARSRHLISLGMVSLLTRALKIRHQPVVADLMAAWAAKLRCAPKAVASMVAQGMRATGDTIRVETTDDATPGNLKHYGSFIGS
ncbi:DNA-directed DNA polymerase epsilon, subunit B [Vermiconidia calcicola]|uniref:DNA-directed DNA polymerase epsilon, subunit B n=1 Tax=Vermiconidia calcicola TaxID=1690605 RepID=A0ACC3N5T5_9PEZI|nr:DNA-directed DNA polymerase epsilon, subunit B [Vermiconidia calcicola]